ncbi:hypothetical protein D3C72_2150830 [compost metagenome]
MAWTTVAAESLMYRASAVAERRVSSSTISSVPPTTSGSSSSRIEISKLMGVNARKWSSSQKPGSNVMAIRKFDRLSRVGATPLGTPVEPEVNRM